MAAITREKRPITNVACPNRECELQVAEGGATLAGKPESNHYGRLGWFIDPEGNNVELWQP